DIDKDGADVLVAEQDFKGMANLLGVGAAAYVQKVGGRSAGILDDVHGRHGQPGAVDQAGDVAVELDVVQVELGGFDLEWVFLVYVGLLLQILVLEERVIVEVDVVIEGEQASIGRRNKGSDLHQRGVSLKEVAVQAGHETNSWAELAPFQSQP